MRDSAIMPIPGLAKLPVELFEEIFEYLQAFTTEYYVPYFSFNRRPPDLKYAERTYALRALSQICRVLRALVLPLLWYTMETIWVPKKLPTGTSLLPYQMATLRCTASLVLNAGYELRCCVRKVVLSFGKSFNHSSTMQMVAKMLEALPLLHTIHIPACTSKVVKQLQIAIQNLCLPSVRVLVLSDNAAPLVKACPNATHIRISDGRGLNVISYLKYCNCQTFDGYICWGAGAMTELLINAPHVQTLEVRPARWGKMNIEKVINEASALRLLRTLVVTFDFPGDIERAWEQPIVEAARKVIRASPASAERELIVRWQLHVYNEGQRDGLSDNFRIDRETFLD